MKISKFRMMVAAIVLSIPLFIAGAHAQEFKSLDTSPLNLTYYNSEEASFGVTSVIISGKKESILIDALFTVPDAEKVAAEIKRSGKKLTAVFISYGDPDYYFGLEVIKKHFPDVNVYATAATIAHIKATERGKLKYWGAQLKEAAPKNVVLPQELKGSDLQLEGQKIEVITAQDAPARDFLYIPSVSAVVGGINVFGDNFNLWLADDATTGKRDLWLSALNKIISLNPKIVIPGHLAPGADLDLKSVNYTKAYIVSYEQILKTMPTSAQLIEALKRKYPNAGFHLALELSAKVNTGEMQWQ